LTLGHTIHVTATNNHRRVVREIDPLSEHAGFAECGSTCS
jgi:hypothetical protein